MKWVINWTGMDSHESSFTAPVNSEQLPEVLGYLSRMANIIHGGLSEVVLFPCPPAPQVQTPATKEP